ncbi:hypothetical protein AZE42_02932 [Rhizopogon vesiculosus]|uniref:Uncharacterized protein n=1 Tax=Rhizopogon vesiculosus TaxID=180088 RepID=A0A1J8QDT5_9AGAM|nr:hypothetical protein AZE42_02932 [Rhizopogon vesiculosus]
MLSASSTSPMRPISHICISPKKASPEPSPTKPGRDDGGYRQRLLSPQCHFSDMVPKHSSPLRPADCPPPRGLHRDHPDLLKASSDRRAALGSRKVPDLRKELAIKNQRNKHLECRARFLSKIQESASPTEVFNPKATPESPIATDCTLPSLGLESPPVSFQSLAKKYNSPIAESRSRRHVWFEQMDSLLPIGKPTVDGKSGRRNLPSLEEIITRIGPTRPPPSMADNIILTSPTPRPFTLLGNDREAPITYSVSDTRPDINIGRLHMPIRRRQSSNPLPDARLRAMPSFSYSPSIEKTAAAVSGTRTNVRYALTEYNVHTLGRANTAREMMTTIRRRTSPPPPGLAHDLDQIRFKRHSAPAEMQLRGRSDFEHPNLSLPGAF